MPYTAKPLLGFTGCDCPLPVQPDLPAIGHGVGNIDVHDAGCEAGSLVPSVAIDSGNGAFKLGFCSSLFQSL
jgi:hypothetical protein